MTITEITLALALFMFIAGASVAMHVTGSAPASVCGGPQLLSEARQ